ncbi:MAG: nitrilase-related carbon-nitrogen hydrolase [Verrucomicrobiia bacterium]
MAEHYLYFPKTEVVPKTGTQGDLVYADAFAQVAEVLHDSGELENLTLLLSTCRNAYLTVNALFVDLTMVLGRGSNRSLIERALYHLQQREVGKASDSLDGVSMGLNIFDQKLRVWNNREVLQAKLQSTLGAKPLAVRSRFERLMHSVWTRDPSTDQKWLPKYYEFSTVEPDAMKRLLEVLHSSREVLGAVVAVARVMVALPGVSAEALATATNQEQLNLLDTAAGRRPPAGPSPKERWDAIGAALRLHAALLEMKIESGDDGEIVVWQDDKGAAANLALQPAPNATGLPLLGAFLDHLGRQVSLAYNRLLVFRPNIALPPLPKVFKVDLTEPVKQAEATPLPAVRVRPCGERLPQRVKIALPQVGIPKSFYNFSDFKFVEGCAHAQEVEHVAEAMITKAAESGANAIIFPEYFLPRAAAQSLAQRASDAGLVIVGGLEGALGGGARLINEVIIQLPGERRWEHQRKQDASVYEPTLTPTDQLVLMQNTSIGTFGVVVCSDYLHWNVPAALADKTRELHFLFVCCCNPNPDLFTQLAVADSARLYCHVVIANNCVDGADPAKASSRGTLVCSPKTRDPVLKPLQSIPLNLRLDGVDAALTVYDVSVEDILTSRTRNAHGYLPIPTLRKPL